MAERQAVHRQKIESQVIHSNITNERWGMVCGVFLASLFAVLGTYLILQDKNASGLTAILTAAVGLAGVFIYRTHRDREELRKKSSER